MKYKNLIILGFIVLIIGFCVYLYLPGYTRYQQIRQKAEHLETEISSLKKRNESLLQECNLLQKDVLHLEKVMRDELGLVKPGEVVYKTIEDVEKRAK
ncbi:MAG: septum formation initiator family protein [Candidatus Omnitrophica bacterium]|nr:septum formation initiator family protein [Candidatus Omnitrophota bacterium]